MMKKIVLFLLFSCLAVGTVSAQKVGFCNVQLILQKMPEYQVAQEKLNELAKEYKAEIQAKKDKIAELYGSYQADKILLSSEMRSKKEEEIKQNESELEKLRGARFGENGDLFTERQKLVRPLQDKVYEAIEEVADRKGYTLILDVSGNASVLYYSEKYDCTEDVLKKMGYL